MLEARFTFVDEFHATPVPQAGTPMKGRFEMTTPRTGTFPEKLKDGYQSFVERRLPDEAKRYSGLAKSQFPEVLLIGCCDSRV